MRLKTVTCEPDEISTVFQAIYAETEGECRLVSVVPLTYLLIERWPGRPEMPPTHHQLTGVMLIVEVP